MQPLNLHEQCRAFLSDSWWCELIFYKLNRATVSPTLKVVWVYLKSKARQRHFYSHFREEILVYLYLTSACRLKLTVFARFAPCHTRQHKRKNKEAMSWTKTLNAECSVHLILKIGPTKVISYIYLNHGCCLKRSEHEHEGKTHDKDIPHTNIERHLASWMNQQCLTLPLQGYKCSSYHSSLWYWTIRYTKLLSKI